MAEVDLMMFPTNVKLKNKHTCIKTRRISKTILPYGRYSFMLPMFDGRKILKQEIYYFFTCEDQEH